MNQRPLNIININDLPSCPPRSASDGRSLGRGPWVGPPAGKFNDTLVHLALAQLGLIGSVHSILGHSNNSWILAFRFPLAVAEQSLSVLYVYFVGPLPPLVVSALLFFLDRANFQRL